MSHMPHLSCFPLFIPSVVLYSLILSSDAFIRKISEVFLRLKKVKLYYMRKNKYGGLDNGT